MSKATTAERALNRKGGTMSRLIKTLFGFYPVLLPLVVKRGGLLACSLRVCLVGGIGLGLLLRRLQSLLRL